MLTQGRSKVCAIYNFAEHGQAFLKLRSYNDEVDVTEFICVKRLQSGRSTVFVSAVCAVSGP